MVALHTGIVQSEYVRVEPFCKKGRHLNPMTHYLGRDFNLDKKIQDLCESKIIGIIVQISLIILAFFLLITSSQTVRHCTGKKNE
jgi:hypothetical protein